MKNVVLLVLLLSVNFIKAQTLNIKRISKEDSLLAEKLFTQGLKFYDNDKFDDAYINFDKSLNINPKKQESYYYRADIKKIKGDLTGALIDFSFLVSIGNNFLETYLQKAEIELILKKYKESIEDYTKVLSFNPKTNLSYYYTKRGYCYKKLGNYIDALKDFNIAINKNPKMNSLYLDKSEICFKLSMFDESVFNATKYITSGDKE